MKRLFVALFLFFFTLPALASFYQVTVPYGKMYLLDRSLLFKFTDGSSAQCAQTDMVTRQRADLYPVNIYQYNCEGAVVRISVYLYERKDHKGEHIDDHVVEFFNGQSQQLEKRTVLNWGSIKVVDRVE